MEKREIRPLLDGPMAKSSLSLLQVLQSEVKGLYATFGKHHTMAVDTHIFRVAERIGLTTKAKNPLDSEQQLIKYIPETIIPKAHHWLLLHGRYTCQARTPKCEKCGIQAICRYFSSKK